MSETSVTTERKPTPTQIVAIIGLGLCLLVFAGGLMIGITIDPRVDLPSRLLAYTTALGGLSAAMACRWVLATGPFERKFCAVLTLSTLALFIGYGLVML
ncbi:MAG TPA: hypothetical protein VL283_00745 [Candidatus Baltobacteraceae bacterium]|jgi:hypothetical protein|nr:hypothetical protein [Candidatus Baltobacteraceae bacterium]